MIAVPEKYALEVGAPTPIKSKRQGYCLLTELYDIVRNMTTFWRGHGKDCFRR
jgi:hypothetical protein